MPRNIAIIIGSKNDLPQCLQGLKYLKTMMSGEFAAGEIQILAVHVRSVHKAHGKIAKAFANIL